MVVVLKSRKIKCWSRLLNMDSHDSRNVCVCVKNETRLSISLVKLNCVQEVERGLYLF